MKTLIIHPEDSSTTFLKPIYSGIKEKTVITGGITKDQLIIEIEAHDRIMMMGHGSPSGLLSIGRFKNHYDLYIIDEDTVPQLSAKKDSVFIWCYADLFVKRHQLNGFYSGMFISEVEEAKYLNLPADEEMIVESNNKFSNIVCENIHEKSDVLLNKVKKEYAKIIHYNPIAKYNHDRLNRA
jgi:hypothetical protein